MQNQQLYRYANYIGKDHMGKYCIGKNSRQLN